MNPWEKTSSGDELDWTGLVSVSPRLRPESFVDLLKISTPFLIRAPSRWDGFRGRLGVTDLRSADCGFGRPRSTRAGSVPELVMSFSLRAEGQMKSAWTEVWNPASWNPSF